MMELEEGYAALYAYGVPSCPNILQQWSVRILPVVLDQLSVSGKFLDIGCGPGHTTNILTQRGLTGCGIDKSEYMIKYARKVYPHLSFHQADVFADSGDNDFVLMLCDVANAMPFEDLVDVMHKTPISAGGTLMFDLNTLRGYERWGDISVTDRRDLLIEEHGVFLGDLATIQLSGFASFSGDNEFTRFKITVKNFYHDVINVLGLLRERFDEIRFFDSTGKEGWNPDAVKVIFAASSPRF